MSVLQDRRPSSTEKARCWYSRSLHGCVFVLPGDQRHVHRAPSDHLLRLHLPGEAAVLDPHAGRRLLAAAVWYDHLEKHTRHSRSASRPGSLIARARALSPNMSQVSQRRTPMRSKESLWTPTCTSWLSPSSWLPSTSVFPTEHHTP